VAEAVTARPDMPPDLARKLEGAADELRITLAILRGARRPRPSRS
jgi:hypothetical protein